MAMRGLLFVLAIAVVLVVTLVVMTLLVIPKIVDRRLAQERARQRVEDAAALRAMVERGETSGRNVPPPRKSRHLYIVPALATVGAGINKVAHEAQQHPRATAAILAGLSALAGLILWSSQPDGNAPQTAAGPPPVQQSHGPRYQTPATSATNSRPTKPSRSGTEPRTITPPPSPTGGTRPSQVSVAPRTTLPPTVASRTSRDRQEPTNPPQTHSEPPRPTPEPTQNPTSHPTTHPTHNPPPTRPTRTRSPPHTTPTHTVPPPPTQPPGRPAPTFICVRLDPILNICLP